MRTTSIPTGTPEREEWRLNIPNVCGKCHVKERALYATSVHGKEVLEEQESEGGHLLGLPHHP